MSRMAPEPLASAPLVYGFSARYVPRYSPSCRRDADTRKSLPLILFSNVIVHRDSVQKVGKSRHRLSNSGLGRATRRDGRSRLEFRRAGQRRRLIRAAAHPAPGFQDRCFAQRGPGAGWHGHEFRGPAPRLDLGARIRACSRCNKNQIGPSGLIQYRKVSS